MGSLTMWFPPSVNLLSLSAPAATVKYHRLSSLETTEIHFSQFWRPGRPGSQCELTCCLAHFLVHSQHLLAVSSQNGREVSKVSEGSSTKALIAFMRIPASWPRCFPKAHWALWLQHRNFERTHTFKPSHTPRDTVHSIKISFDISFCLILWFLLHIASISCHSF